MNKNSKKYCYSFLRANDKMGNLSGHGVQKMYKTHQLS